MNSYDVVSNILGDIYEKWPNWPQLDDSTPGGLTLRYADDLAKAAYSQFFIPEEEASRYRVKPGSSLERRLAGVALDGWSFSFIATQEKVQFERLGRIIDTGRRRYRLQVGILPPLPEELPRQ